MKQEFSFGIIPLRLRGKHWEVLLIQHGKGHWAFPKGHPEPNETPQETALRELQEETGISVKSFFTAPQLKEHYLFTQEGERISKTVIYFLAEVEGDVTVQVEEISDFCWLKLKDAEKKVTFLECKRLCREATELLKNFNV